MKFNKKILDNGFTIIHEKRDVPVTTVAVASKFGAAYESTSEKGISHVIEHLCFKGTDKRNAQQISYEIEKEGGNLNAFTHEEITLYYAKLPSSKMNIALDVLFDIFFNPIFPEEEIKKEIGVICEEIKMRKDNPRIYVCDQLKTNMYESPFGLNIAGDENSVRALTRESIVKKHLERYSPNNSVLCVVGNNSFEEVLNFVEGFKFPENKLSSESEIPKKIVNSSIEQRDGIEQVNLTMGFHFPSGRDDLRYAALVFNSIFGDGMSSRLFLEVREKLGLVYAVKSDLDVGKDYGYLLVYAGTDKSNKDKVLEIIKREFEKMSELSSEELEQAKKKLVGSYLVSSEGSEDSVVNLVLEDVFGDAKNFYLFEENVKKVTLEDIKEIARDSNYSSFVLSP